MPEPRVIARHGFRSACLPEAGDESGNRVFVDSFAPKCGLGAEATLARVGPTTPTRAGRLADASVDPTEARNSQYNAVKKRFRMDQKAWS
jgi:hypothetical protein